jgi:hypothetical protein
MLVFQTPVASERERYDGFGSSIVFITWKSVLTYKCYVKLFTTSASSSVYSPPLARRLVTFAVIRPLRSCIHSLTVHLVFQIAPQENVQRRKIRSMRGGYATGPPLPIVATSNWGAPDFFSWFIGHFQAVATNNYISLKDYRHDNSS